VNSALILFILVPYGGRLSSDHCTDNLWVSIGHGEINLLKKKVAHILWIQSAF